MGVVIRQSIKGTVVTYVGAFIGFLTTFFVSMKFLTAEEIGLTKTLLDSAVLLASIALMGITSSGIKFFPYFKSKANNHHNGFFFYLVSLPFLGCIITFLLALLCKEPITAFFSQKAALFVNYFYLIFPLAFFAVYQQVFETYSYVLMRIVVPRIVREILVRVITVAIFLSYAFRIIDLDMMIYLFVGCYGIATLVDLFYVARIGNISLKHDTSYIRKPLRKSIFSFTGYMVISAIGVGIVAKIDGFMLSAYIGLAAAGIYSIAYFMAVIIEIPSRSLINISMPLLAAHIKEKKYTDAKDLLKKVTLNQFLIGTFVFILIWVNIDNVFAVLPNGEYYSQGKWVVFFIGLARLTDMLGGFSFSILSISKYYYYTLFFILFLSGFTILSNHLLIPILEMNGAAFSTFAAFLIYNSLVIFLVNKKLKLSPFSWGILKITVLTIGILGLNIIFPYCGNPYLDAVARTFALNGLFILVMYFGKISPDANQVINTMVSKAISYIKK